MLDNNDDQPCESVDERNDGDKCRVCDLIMIACCFIALIWTGAPNVHKKAKCSEAVTVLEETSLDTHGIQVLLASNTIDHLREIPEISAVPAEVAVECHGRKATKPR